MDNDHGITGELRTGGIYRFPSNMRVFTEEELTAIADRIDAAHEEALGSKVAGALLANEDGTEFLAIPASKMAERYIELPKDADGEYIHIGDEMETLISPFAGEHCAVEYLILSADGWEVDGDAPTSMRHYRKPTVEDVLREFFSRYVTTKPKDEDDAIIAEYAAKLQLKEEA